MQPLSKKMARFLKGVSFYINVAYILNLKLELLKMTYKCCVFQHKIQFVSKTVSVFQQMNKRGRLESFKKG